MRSTVIYSGLGEDCEIRSDVACDFRKNSDPMLPKLGEPSRSLAAAWF